MALIHLHYTAAIQVVLKDVREAITLLIIPGLPLRLECDPLEKGMANHFSILAFSYCSWGSQGKNTEVACHSFLRWTTFCQTSPQ